jgi:hypothetical protein
VDRALRKVVNSIIKQVDGLAMSAIASAVTRPAAHLAAWNGGSAKFLQDILLAKAVSSWAEPGLPPDTLVVNDAQYAYLMSDTTSSPTPAPRDHQQPGLHRVRSSRSRG